MTVAGLWNIDSLMAHVLISGLKFLSPRSQGVFTLATGSVSVHMAAALANGTDLINLLYYTTGGRLMRKDIKLLCIVTKVYFMLPLHPSYKHTDGPIVFKLLHYCSVATSSKSVQSTAERLN